MGALVIQGVPPELLKREAIEAHVERLIALLDMLDGDTDLEPDSDAEPAGDEDEPSLGWQNGPGFRASEGLDDREQDVGDECEPDADRENWRQPAGLSNPVTRR
ncbi:hypothetical protein [uncultured Enterovirga sp.]|uniref:hypothetical protein n=1 Tax=uncultured Enterovirga sp. TaxID=2026352 RepID=UPI0035CBE590